jgi:hypothetical protein
MVIEDWLEKICTQARKYIFSHTAIFILVWNKSLFYSEIQQSEAIFVIMDKQLLYS